MAQGVGKERKGGPQVHLFTEEKEKRKKKKKKKRERREREKKQ